MILVVFQVVALILRLYLSYALYDNTALLSSSCIVFEFSFVCIRSSQKGVPTLALTARKKNQFWFFHPNSLTQDCTRGLFRLALYCNVCKVHSRDIRLACIKLTKLPILLVLTIALALTL